MAAKIISRQSVAATGPAAGLQPTVVKIFIGDVPEFAEQCSGSIQAYHVLPGGGGALLRRPADYCIGKIYRTVMAERYYVADGSWYEKTADGWAQVCELAI
jgi:hypothetical protein